MFSELMHSGYSFQQCMNYLEDENNVSAFEHAKDRLRQGEPLEMWGSSFFALQLKSYLDAFLRFLPLDEALHLSVVLYDNKASYQKEVMKTAGYPFSMFLFALIGVQLFCAFCMPSLLQMMKGFNVSTALIETVYHALMFFAFLLTICVFGLLSAVVFFARPSNIVEGIQQLHRCHLTFLIQKELSTHFATLYYHTVRMGIPTRTALLMFKQCASQPLVAFLSSLVDEALNNGDDLVEAIGIPYFDVSFQKMMKTVMLSNDAVALLKGYLQVAETKRKKRLQQMAQVVQLVAYAMIGILIVLVYQVLFLPLSMLERM